MYTFSIDEITEHDLHKILSIYNSNPSFLKSHIGTTYISKDFIAREASNLLLQKLLKITSLP